MEDIIQSIEYKLCYLVCVVLVVFCHSTSDLTLCGIKREIVGNLSLFKFSCFIFMFVCLVTWGPFLEAPGNYRAR